MSAKKRRTIVQAPAPKEVIPTPKIRLLALVLTVLERSDDVYASDREHILKQVAFYYGYQLIRIQT